MDQLASHADALQPGYVGSLKITRVTTQIVDLPIKRAHQFAATRISTQAYLVVEIETEGGIVGLGEGATPGGPWWSGDSVETIKTMIDSYLGPAIVGRSAHTINDIHKVMNHVAAANPFAKGAIDMALWDIVGKALGIPIHNLLGGAVRDKLEISWALAVGTAEADIAEAEEYFGNGHARVFKLKAGAQSPDADTARTIAVARAMQGRADVRIDPNQRWDEATARVMFPRLLDGGCTLVEQPIQSWNLDGLARLRRQFNMRIMADESVTTPQTALDLVQKGSADVVALKIMKSGGITGNRQISAILDAGGVAGFGGTFLESSIGASAALHLAAAERNTTFGCELIGGLWLAEEIVEQPLVYSDFHVHVPKRPGLGMSLDRKKLKRFSRA
jgi:muconate/chloromuconate cycloisomerase